MSYLTKLSLTFINLSQAVILACSLTLIFTSIALASEPASPTDAPVHLVIPSIALDDEIVPVGWKELVVDGQTRAQWLVDDNKVGWHNLSAPLGRVGNTVLNGHSDIKGKVFRHLEEVEIGAEIVTFSQNQAYHYVVTEKFLIQEKGVPDEQRIENAKWITPADDERLTLVTCANPGATHRLIIIARPAAEVVQ